MTETLLTVAEVATYCKVTRATILRWIKEQKLAAFKLGHAERPTYRIASSELDAFIARSIVAPRSDNPVPAADTRPKPDMADYLDYCTPCWYARHDDCVPMIVSGGTKMVRCLCMERGHLTGSGRPSERHE